MIRSRIDAGALRPGETLPSTRSLALDLGVSRSTVVVIYEQLAAEGYIETQAGTRARVSPGITPPRVHAKPPASRRPRRRPALSSYGHRVDALELPLRRGVDSSHINFLYGALADEDFPRLGWRRLYNQALTRRQHHLYYGAPEGDAELRAQLQGYLLRARGLTCSPEQIVIVQGSQQAIELCGKVLADPGQHVLVEEPCYLLARRTFESIGAQVTGVPVDEHGLLTASLPTTHVALAYVTPSHQYPLGSVMSISRRQELLAWAKRGPTWIIEDDYDSEFRYGLRSVDPLQTLDTHGSVIYVGTVSKTLSPQLRLGYLVLPPALVKAFRHAKHLADRHSPLLEQTVLAQLIRSGAYERHLRRLRRENEKRRAALIEALAAHLGDTVHIEGTNSGLHVVAWIKDIPMRLEDTVCAKAKAMGVGVWGITPLYAEGRKLRTPRCAGLVLGYGGLTSADIKAGVERLAKAIALIRNGV